MLQGNKLMTILHKTRSGADARITHRFRRMGRRDRSQENVGMIFTTHGWRRQGAPAVLLAAGVLAAGAAMADTTGRDLSASCAACHGTDGHAAGRMATLAGQDREALLSRLRGFRDGSQEATVMHQHAKGYTDEELVRIAEYFASRPGGAK